MAHMPGMVPRCSACLLQVEELMKEYGPMDYGKSTSGQHSVDAMHFDGFLGEGVCAN